MPGAFRLEAQSFQNCGRHLPRRVVILSSWGRNTLGKLWGPKESQDTICMWFSNGFDALWAVGIISERVPRSTLDFVFQSMWCAMSCWDYLWKIPEIYFILCFPMDLMRYGLLGLSLKESQDLICIVFPNRCDALWAVGIISESVPRCNLYCVSQSIWCALGCWDYLRKSPEI